MAVVMADGTECWLAPPEWMKKKDTLKDVTKEERRAFQAVDTDGNGVAFPTPITLKTLKTLAQLAGGDAEGGGAALAACPPASLAPLVHAAHFLDVDDRLRRLLSAALCRRLSGKSYEELAVVLHAHNDYPTAEARQAAVDESIYEPAAPGAPGAPPQPPPVGRSLSRSL